MPTYEYAAWGSFGGGCQDDAVATVRRIATPKAEWVLMYRGGLARTRIGAPGSTVGYYLAVARAADPGLEAAHQEPAGGRRLGLAHTGWNGYGSWRRWYRKRDGIRPRGPAPRPSGAWGVVGAPPPRSRPRGAGTRVPRGTGVLPAGRAHRARWSVRPGAGQAACLGLRTGRRRDGNPGRRVAEDVKAGRPAPSGTGLPCFPSAKETLWGSVVAAGVRGASPAQHCRWSEEMFL
jgi:hypothetical protein